MDTGTLPGTLTGTLPVTRFGNFRLPHTHPSDYPHSNPSPLMVATSYYQLTLGTPASERKIR
jgi:hypothetical protein